MAFSSADAKSLELVLLLKYASACSGAFCAVATGVFNESAAQALNVDCDHRLKFSDPESVEPRPVIALDNRDQIVLEDFIYCLVRLHMSFSSCFTVLRDAVGATGAAEGFPIAERIALLQATQAVGFELLNLAVWVKTNPGMGSLYRSQHELVAVVKRPGSGHRNNVELGKNGRSRSNVWTYRGVNVMGPERHLLYEHPTVKPAALVGDAPKDVTRAGDFVFDPFLGSGSTLIAAERTGRRCVGIEIAPKYVDLTIRRWQAETGGQAVRARDGMTFDALVAQAGGSAKAEEAL
jgi:hypothetical protein